MNMKPALRANRRRHLSTVSIPTKIKHPNLFLSIRPLPQHKPVSRVKRGENQPNRSIP